VYFFKKGGDWNAEPDHAGAGGGNLPFHEWGGLRLLLWELHFFQVKML
jgi:hypothetical protein